MEAPKSANGSDKAFIGDWAETSDGAEAYARSTQSLKASKGAFLQFFAAAFPPMLLPPKDEEGNQRVRGQCLEIGCGPGGFTVNHLLPCLPSWCKKLVAVDNSDAMVKLAREKQPHPKVEYKCLDIAKKEDVIRFRATEGCFGMVFSFGALHWIADQHQAIQNIEKLMVNSGECFLSFVGNMLLFDVFVAVMESPRWKKYSEHLRPLVPVTHGMDKVALRFYAATLLDGGNLIPLACEVFSQCPVVGITAEELADFYTTSNPIYHLLSHTEKQELRNFTNDFLQESVKKNCGKLVNHSTRILIHAYKASSKSEAQRIQ